MLKNILNAVDELRIEKNSKLDESTRANKGQYMTPASAARLIAGKFRDLNGALNIIDAGAGVGSLTTALVERALNDFSPNSINANAWELESVLLDGLNDSFKLCEQAAGLLNVAWSSNVNNIDFISHAVSLINKKESGQQLNFNKAILNPPYLKIAASSNERKLLRSVGVETGNLYSCFVALALMLLDTGGELVAITPRSFCNGPYFNDFRRLLLDGNNLNKIHVFESRTSAFKGDSVLQENVIFHIIKGEDQGKVEIISSRCADDETPDIRMADFDEVVSPNNSARFIHIVTNDKQAAIAKKIGGLPCSLEDLGIEVSTGKVVDFRTKENLRDVPGKDTVPLIHPMHFDNGLIKYPILHKKKSNAIVLNEVTRKMMVPNGTYILIKRLTSKEEKRRIVAALYTESIADVKLIGFENKTNYLHAKGKPLDLDIAKGLLAYLNSHVVDQYFRQFNGHTQVNAADLFTLRYPSREQLTSIGQQVYEFNQDCFDDLTKAL
ncbi:TPA: Eco57I restriction-modification methylase domain-containing protein [Yersinia enterocolitica]|nr:modification methylase [Yersinia enterocolitica]ELI7978604.1 Eco57I restriction-modification methylase domain-containing protein [Yersinia enterocolitica]HDX5739628.1 Eco57I restriction-modification methylase domain-containing protein [Yersinia enterocolitica]